jgi:hypothetical protein
LHSKDKPSKKEQGFSFIDLVSNRHNYGLEYMVDKAKRAAPEKKLQDENGNWITKRVMEYLAKKKKYCPS